MPLETVDVKKWAQQRFSNDVYNSPVVRSNSTAQEDLSEVKRLLRQGKNGRAMAKALQLKVRLNNQQRTLSKEDLTWLNNYINSKGVK